MTSDYYADTKAPMCPLVVKPFFDALDENHKRYAHHLSRASHWGTRVVLRQVSPESEAIYDLVLDIYKAVGGNWADLESKSGLSSDEIEQFKEYASQFLSNLGNYKSFGDAKFIPRLKPEAFRKIALVTPETAAQFDVVAEALYSTKPESKNLLGYADKGHLTAYYSPNVTKAEIEAVQKLTADHGILPENTRLFKDGDEFKLTIASADSKACGEFKDHYTLPDGRVVRIEYGDHTKEFVEIVKELEQARKYAANDIQKSMLDSYIESFKTGSMEAHKESQRQWVKDIGPKVENNIGFIETYRDPAGVRGEWEGLVAMVNEEQTAKFGELVNNAKKYIDQLPWPKEFEKDVFTPPDFTSLEVLTFAGSGIPAGINIPNYDDVRLNIGFKNVSLGNVLSAKAPNEKTTFIAAEELELFDKYRGPAFEVQVGIHELLGHGSGKLLSETGNGEFNFDHEHPPISPLTNKPVTTYYKKGQTWGSLFGAIAGSYEECRAESVAMYLSTDASILKIFGHEGQEADDVLYITYLLMARAGLIALEFWDPATGKWGQAHMQARYSILKCFRDAGIVEFESSKDDFSDLIIRLDRAKIPTVGKDAVGKYLQRLHIYKSSGDVEEGTKFYNEMTTVTPDMAKFRPVVLAKKLPRKQFIQANTVIENGTVVLKEYDADYSGMIKSFVERQV
ncbi:hypothetical protein TRVA0_040S00254 [Trichomonascus vanleenenianus]|uniref:dipeptidyl-peptidase III n=1 Tax=Trichomonascus vanleenenianus TaxID=2268995 RepID=UPI003ECB404B